MKYELSNLIGDAGEHLLAAKIIKYFGFPCRLTNIDIGIDAEIELIDSNRKSTGELIKCQVKTTTQEKSYIYIKERHLQYWNTINAPVIVFLVNLKSEKIYWHCVDKINNYAINRAGVKIEFCETDKLVRWNKKRFEDIASFKQRREVENCYDEAWKIVIEHRDYLNDEEFNYDLTQIVHLVEKSIIISGFLEKARKILNKNSKLSQINELYSNKLKIVNEFMKKLDRDRQIIQSDYGHDYFDYLN